MTDRLGRRATWTTALVAAPGTAALFGLATSWAISTGPQAAQPAVTAQPVPATQSDRSDRGISALQHSISANQKTLATLQRQLAELRRQLAATTAPPARARATGQGSGTVAGSSQPVAAGPVGTGNGSAGSPAPVAAGAPANPGPVAAPSAAPPPAPAPAPPVQTTTGASGKKP